MPEIKRKRKPVRKTYRSKETIWKSETETPTQRAPVNLSVQHRTMVFYLPPHFLAIEYRKRRQNASWNFRQEKRKDAVIFVYYDRKQAAPKDRKKHEKASPSRQNRVFIHKKRRNHRENRKRTGRQSLFCKKSCKVACIAGKKAIQ